MKILFSNPPWWEQSEGGLRCGIRAGSRWPFTRRATFDPGHFKFGSYYPAPFFLQHSAAHTQTLLPDANIQIRDSIARGETYEEFGKFVNLFAPDFVVLESATSSLDHDLRIIQSADTFGWGKVILCGPIDCDKHAAIFEKHPNVHAIVQGEYDKQIALAVNAPRGTVLAHNLLTREEMAASPLPMWDEVCATNYWDGCPRGQRPPHIQLLTSRGCYHVCSFCAWPAIMTGNDPNGLGSRPVRFYPPEYIERHIASRLALHKYQSVYIDDDCFNLSDAHVLKVCGVMRKFGLPWLAMCRIDSSKDDTWRAMRASGCVGVKVGIESGSQRVLDEIIGKKLDLSKVPKQMQFLKSLGLSVHTTWTLGHPGETPEESEMTQRLIRSLPSDTVQVSGTSVISGTPLDHVAKGEHLEKFPGAVATPEFLNMVDGQKKAELLTK